MIPGWFWRHADVLTLLDHAEATICQRPFCGLAGGAGSILGANGIDDWGIA